MLKNAYLDAKIGVDTAENEPSKSAGTSCFPRRSGGVPGHVRAEVLLQVGVRVWVMKFWQILANFGRLVLSCIDVSDSESRRIFQHFSKSTRSAFFCTAPNSKISQNFGILLKFAQHFAKIAVIRQNLANFAEI